MDLFPSIDLFSHIVEVFVTISTKTNCLSKIWKNYFGYFAMWPTTFYVRQCHGMEAYCIQLGGESAVILSILGDDDPVDGAI